MRNKVIKNDLYDGFQNSISKRNYHTEKMDSGHISRKLMDHAFMGETSITNPKLCWKHKLIHQRNEMD
jgi:hypothetical protein